MLCICLPRIHFVISGNTGVDENVANVVEGAADAVENQANADRDATLSDRLKMAGMHKLKEENITIAS